MPSMTGPPEGAEALVDIGSRGQRLLVVSAGPAEMWDAWIVVEAHPFSGVIRTTLTEDDVRGYRESMQAFEATGRARLGGWRAPQIDLERDDEMVTVTVTTSGDDPWPTIAYQIILSADPDPGIVPFRPAG